MVSVGTVDAGVAAVKIEVHRLLCAGAAVSTVLTQIARMSARVSISLKSLPTHKLRSHT
jgi:hypothetical protein